MTPQSRNEFFRHPGVCPICELDVDFVASGPYFRSSLRCSNCASAPRNRAFMHVLKTYFPDWRHSAIHESSPGRDLVSKRLAAECACYTATQYDITVPFGAVVGAPEMPCGRYQSENLERQTFSDECFNLVVMQDVFEHVFYPDRAIKEIARTLKSDGALVMTVPIVRKNLPSRRRAALHDGILENLLEAQFHGNPLSSDGSLVTIDWGYDIALYLQQNSGMHFMIVSIDDIDKGIRADLNEVLIGFKSPSMRL